MGAAGGSGPWRGCPPKGISELAPAQQVVTEPAWATLLLSLSPRTLSLILQPLSARRPWLDAAASAVLLVPPEL